ncbi:hypothetical protein FLO80_21490 [Aquicoccus porphyridii]|uniref:Hedgehog/Intein (Hint) domain-containing protein n=1 Tax=Aquicoccus porphyridii TaxID=1852029 RepID=A0A5A9YX97_9RHOB|nr:Hint domain-containing protein [Aquicoccus porphyridii]KAA0909457.1 hypothetical protein FLO80_21490 [Aquicoccus porphyridii]RAI51777.1 hypothetical protein DOO74_21435 [Rhodobacteraceae bacterium AsT-22]
MLYSDELRERAVFPVRPGLFAAGSKVMTLDGPIAIEKLNTGDRIITYDRGAEPIQGRLRVVLPARGQIAPICIGNDGADGLTVSPHTLLMVSSPYCEHHFGSARAMVRAASLRGDRFARVIDQGEMEFISLYINDAAMIYVEGMICETAGTQEKSESQHDSFLEMLSASPTRFPVLSDEEARLLYKLAGGAVNILKLACQGWD